MINNSKKNFENKYNFDLTEELSKKTNEANSNEQNKQILDKTNSLKLNEASKTPNFDDISTKYDEDKNNLVTRKSFNVDIQLNNEIEVKKIKEDNKNYYFNLKRKILLNHKLLLIFLDNFYRDEFNYSRKTSYLIFVLPLCVFAFFKAFSPFHPFLGISLGMSISSSLISFAYYFRKETSNLGHLEHSIVGRKIRDIKNELSLINPLAKPILDNDLIKKNRKI